MKPEQLRIALDKYIEAIPENADSRGRFLLREQTRKDMKAFTEKALEGMLKSIGSYGTNTHSYGEAQAYLIEFRGKV